MDNWTFEKYLLEMETQGQFAMQALDEAAAALQRRRGNPPTNFDEGWRDHREVFRNLHSFIIHVGNISKLIWPGSDSEQATARGEELRRVLRMPEWKPDGTGHPLQDRSLRNHLEHYDERLDAWATTGEQQGIMLDNIGPPDSVAGLEPENRMRHFDPAAGEFVFRDEHFDLKRLRDQVEHLLEGVAKVRDRIRDIRLDEPPPPVTDK